MAKEVLDKGIFLMLYNQSKTPDVNITYDDLIHYGTVDANEAMCTELEKYKMLDSKIKTATDQLLNYYPELSLVYNVIKSKRVLSDEKWNSETEFIGNGVKTQDLKEYNKEGIKFIQALYEINDGYGLGWKLIQEFNNKTIIEPNAYINHLQKVYVGEMFQNRIKFIEKCLKKVFNFSN